MKKDNSTLLLDTIAKIDEAVNALKEQAQGRAFDVGVQVMYNGKLGIVTDLNKDSTDVEGSTIDIRLSDGKVIEKVPVNSSSLKRYRG